jgi:hypothetical protein
MGAGAARDRFGTLDGYHRDPCLTPGPSAAVCLSWAVRLLWHDGPWEGNHHDRDTVALHRHFIIFRRMHGWPNAQRPGGDSGKGCESRRLDPFRGR